MKQFFHILPGYVAMGTQGPLGSKADSRPPRDPCEPFRRARDKTHYLPRNPEEVEVSVSVREIVGGGSYIVMCQQKGGKT